MPASCLNHLQESTTGTSPLLVYLFLCTLYPVFLGWIKFSALHIPINYWLPFFYCQTRLFFWGGGGLSASLFLCLFDSITGGRCRQLAPTFIPYTSSVENKCAWAGDECLRVGMWALHGVRACVLFCWDVSLLPCVGWRVCATLYSN